MFKIIKKSAISFVLIVFFALSLMADSGFLGGSFADNGIATRALAMGGAYTAIASDANASWWNPAGMALLGKTKSVSFTYVPQMYDLGESNISRAFITYAQGDMYGFGALGGSLNYTSMKMAGENSGDPENVWTEITALMSWGMQIDKFVGLIKYKYPKVSVGVNVKYLGVNSDLEIEDTVITASGVSFDASLMVAFKDNLNLGIMAKDIYSMVNWTGGSQEKLPYILRGGLYYGITADFLLSAEVKTAENGSGSPAVELYCAGVEYGASFGSKSQLKKAVLRAGVSIDPNNDTYVISGGASAYMENFAIDYAYQHTVKTMLEPTHRFGLTINF